MARSAAAKLPGDMEVSASIRTMPSLGTAAAISSMKSRGWQSAMSSMLASGAATPRQGLEALVLEHAIDGAQPIGALGMTGGGEVIEAGRMGDVEGGHSVVISLQVFAARLTPAGGLLASGTKKSGDSGWLGSAR